MGWYLGDSSTFSEEKGREEGERLCETGTGACCISNSYKCISAQKESFKICEATAATNARVINKSNIFSEKVNIKISVIFNLIYKLISASLNSH